MKFFDSEKFTEDYGICVEETVDEADLEEKEDLKWEEYITR